MTSHAPDHGGGVDAAAQQYGGVRSDWLDLSTGINPVPYVVPEFSAQDWCVLPDRDAFEALTTAARSFWRVPQNAAILAAPGASCLIARIPALMDRGKVYIPQPSYNEHRLAFSASGWEIMATAGAGATVLVHPNNPDGRQWGAADVTGQICVIDESFCDLMPEKSLIAQADRPGVIVLKSFGKFWGLAGLRLGFAIGDPGLIGHLAQMLGPWPVSGPALRLGAQALGDGAWAIDAQARLTADAARLDALMCAAGATVAGGTGLFRLYDTDDAGRWQRSLARAKIWTRIFPYSARWLRLGLPGCAKDWTRLAHALDLVGAER